MIGDQPFEVLEKSLVALSRNSEEVLILNGYENLSSVVDSDVDCMVWPDRLPSRVASALYLAEISIVQILQRGASTFVFILEGGTKTNPEFVWLDICSDIRKNGKIVFRMQDVYHRSLARNSFRIPAVDQEYLMVLIKRLGYGGVTREHGKRLQYLYSLSPEKCRERLVEHWSVEKSEAIIRATLEDQWNEINDQALSLASDFYGSSIDYNFREWLGYWGGEHSRLMYRMCHPTGVHVAILGPDGSGKSTIIAKVDEALAPAFRQTNIQHLFPCKPDTAATPRVTDPHGEPTRSGLQSLAKIVLWSRRYTIGYARHIRPKLVRSALVISDRYFPDIIVDPKRYRYGGPSWLPKVLWCVLPKPDLVILLDAPPEVLQARKQEVPFAETERQIEAYRELVGGMKNGHIINANQPVDDVVADVNSIILDFMAARTRKRLGLKAPSVG